MARKPRIRKPKVASYSVSLKNYLASNIGHELTSEMAQWAASALDSIHVRQRELTGKASIFYKRESYGPAPVVPLHASLVADMEEVLTNRERVRKDRKFIEEFISNRLLTAHSKESAYYLLPNSVKHLKCVQEFVETHEVSTARLSGLPEPKSDSLFDKRFDDLVAKYIGLNALFGDQQ